MCTPGVLEKWKALVHPQRIQKACFGDERGRRGEGSILPPGRIRGVHRTTMKFSLEMGFW